MPISVNLSVVQFTHPNLVSEISRVLKQTKFPPQFLELEITESVLMQDTTLAVSILNKLSEVGIKISIDDFGTGFSSLNYLKNLPLDYLKIDQTFVKDYNLRTNSAITKAIVTLAQSLNMKTIADYFNQPIELYQTSICRLNENGNLTSDKPSLQMHEVEETAA